MSCKSLQRIGMNMMETTQKKEETEPTTQADKLLLPRMKPVGGTESCDFFFFFVLFCSFIQGCISIIMSLKESYQPMDVPPEAPPWREWSGNLTGGLEKGLQGCGVDRSEFYPQI